MKLLLDSGAVTLYNTYSRKGVSMGEFIGNRKNIDYSFYETDKFLSFRDEYLDFVKEYEDQLDGYINMDVINNAKKSYESWQYMKKKGANPIPVFHIGCEPEYLQKYMDDGADFIALGGITPNPYTVVKPILDTLWKSYLLKPNGKPKVRVHGLAVTSVRLMFRYPWWSVDSATWIKVAAYGNIFVPLKKNGKYEYKKNPIIVSISSRNEKVGTKNFLHGCSPIVKDYIIEYLEEHGFNADTLSTDHEARMMVNLEYYNTLQDILNKEEEREISKNVIGALL